MTHNRGSSSVQKCLHSAYENAAEWPASDDLEYSIGAIKDAGSANKGPGSHDNLLAGLLYED